MPDYTAYTSEVLGRPSELSTDDETIGNLQRSYESDPGAPNFHRAATFTEGLARARRAHVRRLQMVATFIGRSSVFKCCICLSNQSLSQRVVFTACQAGNKHGICRSCAQIYLSGLIKENRLSDLRCPLHGQDGCEALVSETEIQRYVTEEVFHQFKRFAAQAADPLLRECPQCQELVKPLTIFLSESNEEKAMALDLELGQCTDRKPPIPEMKCSQGHTFCFYHSQAHAPGREACKAYELDQVKQQKMMLLELQGKECPCCGLVTTKSEGCNHMKCPNCKADWCWTCGKNLGGARAAGWHYNPVNPLSCQQFVDFSTKAELQSYQNLCIRVISFPGTLLGLIIFWSTFPTWITGVGILLTIFLLIVSLVSWWIVTMPIICCAPCLQLSSNQVMMVMMAPFSSCWASVECICGSVESSDS